MDSEVIQKDLIDDLPIYDKQNIEISNLSKKLSASEEQRLRMKRELSKKDSELSQKDSELSQKDNVILQKDRIIEDLKKELEEYKNK